MTHEDKENNAVDNSGDKIPKSIKKPSVLEYLGPDWKEYFLKPETINRIVHEAIRRRLIHEDKRIFDFVDIESITQFGANRQRIIVMVRQIERGLIRKWSIDISSTTLLWDQILDALYGLDDVCSAKIVLFFEPLAWPSKLEIMVDCMARSTIMLRSTTFKNTISWIDVMIDEDCAKKNDDALWFLSWPINIGVHISDKLPPRSECENGIWECYYDAFQHYTVEKACESPLITDQYEEDSTIPFLAIPKWTEKGLFMRLYVEYNCPEMNWLIKDKKEELARRYPGCKMKVNVKSRIPYCVGIQLHDAPVKDFIESSTMDKFSYASEIREQVMALIKHVEEIFQDYVPESE